MEMARAQFNFRSCRLALEVGTTRPSFGSLHTPTGEGLRLTVFVLFELARVSPSTLSCPNTKEVPTCRFPANSDNYASGTYTACAGVG